MESSSDAVNAIVRTVGSSFQLAMLDTSEKDIADIGKASGL